MMTSGDVAIVVASIAVIVTFVGIIISDKRTRDSNKLTRMELEQRLRPWIKIHDLEMDGVRMSKGDYPWKMYQELDKTNYEKPDEYLVNINYENISSIASKQTYQTFLVKNKEFTKKDLLKEGETVGSIPIVPGEKFPNSITITKNQYENSLESPMYIGIRVKYSINNDKFNVVGKIWKWTKNQWTLQEYWVDES